MAKAAAGKEAETWATSNQLVAWVIITQEDADATNLNVAQLRADIDALHGTHAPTRP